MKKRALLIIFLLVLTGYASAENHYVTQDGAGSMDGSSSANAWSVDNFNDAANWNTAANTNDKKIGPGDTVYFSGTITTKLLVQGSGTSGNYITLDGLEGGNYDAIGEGNDGQAVININEEYNGGGTSIKTWDSSFGASGGKDYLIIQDFEIEHANIAIGVNGESDHIIIRRNYAHDMFRNCYSLTESGPDYVGVAYITLGGALGDGNVCKDAGVGTAGADVVMAGHDTHDIIVSYNNLYATKSNGDPGDRGIDGVVPVNAPYDILIEYNSIHDHDDAYASDAYGCGASCVGYGEDGIDIKDDNCGPGEWSSGTHDIIVRYNHVYNHPYQSNFQAQSCSYNIYVYGNRFHDSKWGAFWLYEGAGGSEHIFHDIYMFSNIAYNEYGRGAMVLISNGGTSTAPYDIYWWNNLFAETAFGNLKDGTNSYNTQITMSPYDAPAINPGKSYIKNNVFYKSRPGHSSDQEVQISVSYTDYPNIDYNRFYWPGKTSKIHSGSSLYTASAYGTGNSEGDPGLTNIDNHVYTVEEGSPLIDSGISIGTSAIATLNIEGGDGVSKDYPVYPYIALDPSTNWDTIPPTVITADQNEYGSGWERGAYVYTGDGVSLPTCPEGRITATCLCGATSYPSGYCCSGIWQGTACTASTYSCTGQVPANAAAYDSEESMGLGEDTSWTYSVTDTGVKCQYRCNPGFTWSGSACVAQQQTNSYMMLKTKNPVVVDGNLNEFANANAIIISNSRGTIGTYRFLWDSNYLYVAADVSDTKLNADLSHQEDDPIYRDDSLEMMFDTANNGGASMDYSDDYKFFININDIHSDTERFDTGWDSGIANEVIATGTINNNADTDSGYVIEARIPWTNWAIPSNNSIWGMNIALNDKPDATTYPTQTAWSGSAINIPDDAGDITFSSQFVDQGESVCNSGADSNADGVIAISELINYISQWKAGSVTIGNLIEAIGKWKGGC